MKKALVQLILTLALFFSLWFALTRVNWMSILKIEKARDTTEEKLGDLFWDLFQKSQNELDSITFNPPVDSLLKRICEKNGIENSSIKLHLIDKDELNAFALPDRHLVVYSGLIEACENEAELCGVLGHEIAHMEKNHIMKKLIKETGLSVLISMTAGGSGAEVIKETLKMLSSTAYDRELEKEADKTSVTYLVNANIDPEPFANFLYRLSTTKGDADQILNWVSTHPDSEERAKTIIEYIKPMEIKRDSVLGSEKWNLLKEQLKTKE
jgi:beta-barrel assembly-enhancing protease